MYIQILFFIINNEDDKKIYSHIEPYCIVNYIIKNYIIINY